MAREKTEINVVDWLDAVSNSGWEDLDTDDAPHPCTSVGFVAYEDDVYVTIAATFAAGPPAQTNNRISIPKGWITSRRVVHV